MVEYSGEMYRYVHNLQGDVVGILDDDGNLVVEYKYDAWGKPITVSPEPLKQNTLGELNPFKYRAYLWDSENELYYLQSRYYDPAIGRFINADIIQDSYESVIHPNLYCYCLNNPQILVDSDGRFALLALGICLGLKAFVEAVAVTVVYTACVVMTAVVATEVVDYVTESLQTQEVENEQARRKNTKHLHHIVAKEAWRAAPARKILLSYGITPKSDPRNLVAIDASLHRKLHTKVYYEYVNVRILEASIRSGKEGVINTLASLAIEIAAGTVPH